MTTNCTTMHEVESSTSGLHQANFDPDNPLQYSYKQVQPSESTVVSVFTNLSRRWRNITCTSKTIENTHTCVDGGGHDEGICLNNLPLYCKLVILSHLNVTDICNLSTANQHWYDICSDKFLWRELLCRDSVGWNNICHKSNPLLKDQEMLELYCNQPIEGNGNTIVSTISISERLRCRGPIDYKELYIQCAQQKYFNTRLIGIKPSTTSTIGEIERRNEYSFPRFLRSIWVAVRPGNGQVIMFGPGMESKNTSTIFMCLLRGRPDLFEIRRLLPGGQEGVGSGVELEFKGEKRFNLVALYSNNWMARRNLTGMERLLNSRMLDNSSATDAMGTQMNGSFVGISRQFTLSVAVLNFLRRMPDNRQIIYVVDATKGQEMLDISYNRLELQALLQGIREVERGSVNGNETPYIAPVLVICCCANADAGRIPCVEIASYLDLAAITDRPWFAQDVNVNNLEGLEIGLTWLFKH